MLRKWPFHFDDALIDMGEIADQKMFFLAGHTSKARLHPAQGDYQAAAAELDLLREGRPASILPVQPGRFCLESP